VAWARTGAGVLRPSLEVVRVRQAASGGGVPTGRAARPDVVWRLRQSRLVRGALRSIAVACLGMLAVVALFTLFFVWAFGHPVAWSVVGCLFAALPLAGLVLTVGVGLRAAVAAGPRWVAVRILRGWRVVDLGQVRVVRLADDGPVPGFAFSGWGGFGGPGSGGRALVLEDAAGRRVDIGVDALESGLVDVVRQGLGPDVEVDPAAARALGRP